jgi:integrase
LWYNDCARNLFQENKLDLINGLITVQEYAEALPTELFKPKVNQPIESKPLTVQNFYDSWIQKKKPPFVRKTLERHYRQAFKKNILPFMGALVLNSVTVETLEDFRLHLVEERKLSLKSARNIIDGALRPMFRDAGRRIERNPFNDIPKNWWPRLRKKEPDPFTETERDSILAFYKDKRPYWSYAFVFFRFYTGTRPSEAAALRWGNVDLLNAKATIEWSRTLGEENATKTEASARTFSLLTNVVDLLDTLRPQHAEAVDYVFTDDKGKPLDQNEFGRNFGTVLGEF